MEQRIELTATVVMDIPFPLEDITLAAFRKLHEKERVEVLSRYPEVGNIYYEFPCDLEQRIRVCDLPGFVSAHKLPWATRSDYGAVDRFRFKWKRESGNG